MNHAPLRALLDAYLGSFPKDKPNLQLLYEQLAAGERLNDRKNFHGHIIGDGIVLSPDRTKVLMVHHKFLDRWLQPGGHWDPGEPDMLAAARREVSEETGIRHMRYLPLIPNHQIVPLHIAVSHIPANPRRSEPAHIHYDFRYVFIANSESIIRSTTETNAVQWFLLTAPEVAVITEDIMRLYHVLRIK